MADNNQSSEFTYYAFISYNSKDTKWGKRLQRKLEQYRMPAKLCSERGWKRKPMEPVFFAPTDIQPGELTEELKKHLKVSKYLIVICSPNSAKSEWVGWEIAYFRNIGRDKDIYFFIVDGIPNSGDPETECFHPVVKNFGIQLGANIHEKNYRWPWLNRERAYVQLISKLLGVKFDSIWKRHKRQLIAKSIAWIVGIISVLAAMILIWVNNQPFDTKVQLEEVSVHNPNLPPLREAVITMYLDRETKTDTILCEGDAVNFVNIPHQYLGNDVRITFTCQDFIPLDTIIPLTKDVTLKISRDAVVYGNIQKMLWLWREERGVPNTKIRIDNWEAASDADGIVRMTIPLAYQKENYIIEIPSWNITDTVFMPCAEGQIIELEQ
ncbi:MAG: toll/interleukin-1 receptor domain-containing protein [Muribaculaceae bacterium]|nr:toll/interleukin-1 receptor domain-containing protein [Muribaculaceae bacterium]